MKVSTLPSFTQLSLLNKANNDRSTQYQNLSIASKLDDATNKYSTEKWKSEPVSSHYRNTYVEMQNKNFMARLNKI